MKTILIASVVSLASATAAMPPVYANNEGDLAALLHVMVMQENAVCSKQLRDSLPAIVAAQLEQNRVEFAAIAQVEQDESDEVVNKQVEKAADELAP